MFDVILSPEATVFYEAADRPLARKLGNCFARLEADPRFGGNIKRLTGPMAGLHRYRVGDWRVLYRIEVAERRVVVLVIAHRREVYD